MILYLKKKNSRCDWQSMCIYSFSIAAVIYIHFCDSKELYKQDCIS